MGNQNTIELRLTVKDDGTVVVQQFGKNTEASLQKTDKATKSATDTLDKYKKAWLEITATVGSAGLVFYKTLQYMELGAKAMQSEDTFGMMTRSIKADSVAMLAAIQQASARTIDESKSMQKAVFALDQDIDPNKLPQLFEAARIVARKMGVDVEQTADRIIDSVATQMPRSLKQMGLITKEQMEIFTRAFAAGRTDVDLLNFVIANTAVTTARMGGVTENATERVQQLKAALQDLKESAGKELVENLDSLYSSFKKFGDIKAPFPLNFLTSSQIVKGFMGTPYKKPKTLGPESTDDLTSFWIEQNVAIAEANRKALDDKEKGKIAAIRIAEDEAKNLKAINDIRLKDYENMTKAKEAVMRLASASELEVAKYDLDRQLEFNRLDYESKKKSIYADAYAMSLKDKYFDKAAYISGQLTVLEADRVAKYMEYVGKSQIAWEMADNYRRASSVHAAAWEQKQILDMVEFRRTQGGRRFAVDAATWEQIQNYERLTGEKMEADQVRMINETVQLYKRDLVGGVRWAFMEIEDEYSNTGQLMGDFTKRTFSNMADMLAENTLKMKWDFTDFANSAIKDLLRIYYQQQVLGPLAGAAGSFFGPTGWLASEGYLGPQAMFNAVGVRQGGVFINGNIVPFAKGDIITHRMFFPMANGNIAEVGEAGYEGIVPLERMSNNKLGVNAIIGSGGANVVEHHYHYEVKVDMPITAMDSQSVSQQLAKHQGQIVGMVQIAFNKIGKKGPLG